METVLKGSIVTADAPVTKSHRRINNNNDVF